MKADVWRSHKRIRSELTDGLSKDSAKRGWKTSNQLSIKDFITLFSSTVNRFYNFLDAEKLRLMFGQNGSSLDLGKAMEEGQIIIANLSTEGARVSEEDASLFATLLLSDLWTAAKERGKGTEELEAFAQNRLNRFEPAIAFIKEAKQATILLAEGNSEQKRDFLKKIGSNFQMANKSLAVEFKKPWNLLVEFNFDLTTQNTRQREFSQKENWRWLSVKVRTFFEENPTV
ncbi:MAG: hypothetical protein P4N60_00670 [Verrucomicrobiae bacterium]|nr:hypothetical protein [Verrucomicrobiae bacterium]